MRYSILVDSFLAGVAEPMRSELAASPELAQRLEKLLDEARARWSDIEIPSEPVMRWIGERVAIAGGLDRMQAVDLYLACGCAAGNSRAIASFDAACLPDIRRLLARLPVPGISEQDVHQIVRQRLFVGDGERAPKIRDYVGTGELRSWVRVIITRTVLDLRRGADVEKRHAALEDAAFLVSTAADPELEYLKRLYATEFKTAFEEAAGALSKRDRNLLRSQIVFGLSIDQIAAIYHVHRATAARWLEGARKELTNRTRDALVMRVEVSHGQLDSILRLIESQLDLSIQRILSPAKR